MITPLRIIVGLGILTLGRQLYWLFIGGVGFIFGVELATRLLAGRSQALVLILALVIGFVAALIALFVQRLAIGIAGFLGGSVIAVSLLSAFNLDLGSTLIPYLLGGIVGAVMVSLLFDWALIILSAFAGASIVVDAFDFAQSVSVALLVLLVVVGIAIQANQFQRSSAEQR